jgi:xylulokinase
MTVFAGVDLGTSGIKVALLDTADAVLAAESRPVAISAPYPGWSEQHPDLWWDTVAACFDALAAARPDLCAQVAGIGLSGHMLGAVLLDAADRPVRPAILWNDQRAVAECAELLARVPDIGLRTNAAPDPGVTAPKLLWLARHEPAALDRARMLMLPKDYVRLRLTGETATEPSDASGTQLMDCATARWDAELCAAVGWSIDRLPPVIPSWSAAGGLRPDLARRWGMRPGLPVAAGAGDNFAGALGAGVARPGQAVTTVGTSAVICVADAAFRPAPEKGMLTSPHAAPGAFLSMAVVMSATASLDWLARLAGVSVPALAAEIDAFVAAGGIAGAPVAFPAFAGLRAPVGRPEATAALSGLTPGAGRAALGYAILEGVAFQLADCLDAQRALGLAPETMRLVGGGARSDLWTRMLATLFGLPMERPADPASSAAAGAARLAAVAAGAGRAEDILPRAPALGAPVAPDPALAAALAARRPAFARLARL